MTDVEAAWEAVHQALDRLPGWEATRPHWRSEERLWAASAFYAGHLRPHETTKSPRRGVPGALVCRFSEGIRGERNDREYWRDL